MTLTTNINSYKKRLVNTYNELKMNDFISSIAWGKPGQYNYFGISITFKEGESLNPYDDFLTRLFKLCLQETLSLGTTLSLRRLYVLTHEMGHALAATYLTNVLPEIEMGKNPDQDRCICKHTNPNVVHSEKVENIIAAAGPLSGAFLASCNIVRASGYWNISPSLMIFLGLGAFIHMLADLCYLITSSSKRDNDDWGKIAKSNIYHFCIAAMMMVMMYALSLLMAYNIASI
jgi:hypothetical protein